MKRTSKVVSHSEDVIQRGKVKYKPKPKHWLHEIIDYNRGLWCVTCDEAVGQP